MPNFLQVILLIFAVVMCFNVIIFVHELGHFLAGRWRGLQIDRFQIWFGKPIWKKEINGVQSGLGWIPAGGFVALPQMAPMEAIEGGNSSERQLPAISPLDKIIVAFAGPLFSMLLALLAAVVVWGVGKPKDFIATTEVGFVESGSPAEKAGIKFGDKIIAVNGEGVTGFQGSFDCVFEKVVLSRGDEITFTIERKGESTPLQLKSGFITEETKWFQRKGIRDVGIQPFSNAIVGDVIPNSPAADAKLQKGERITSVDGIKLHSLQQLSQHLRNHNWKPVRIAVESNNVGKEIREIELTPEKPLKPSGTDPMLGISWADAGIVDKRIVHPNPFAQVADTVRQMWMTITTVVAPNSSINVGHLSGPVGIAKLQYQLLQTEDGWRRLLGFMVLFNVNLAILNMLPFPVLDGGHITLALLEKITGRPVKAKPLEIVQTACALALISLMLFVTSKDIGDGFGRGGSKSQEIVFPAN
jgi:regulator of sigma E protease